MSKRAACNYLTHDNWDQEDDDNDEVGVFKNASESELQKRTIIKAKRKTQGQKTTNNAFTGFSFGSVSSSSDPGFAIPTFSFGSKAEASVEPRANGSSAKEPVPVETSTSSKDPMETEKGNEGKPSGAEDPRTNSEKDLDPDVEYLRQMKLLNQSFCKWISDCVAKNPDCILTPCFDDYSKYVENLDKKYPCVGSVPGGSTSKKQTNAPTPVGDEMKSVPEVKKTEEKPKAEAFPVKSTFSFLAPESGASLAKNFSFGSVSGKGTAGSSSLSTIGEAEEKNPEPMGEKTETSSPSGLKGIGFSFARTAKEAVEKKPEAKMETTAFSSGGFPASNFSFGSGSFVFGATKTTAATESPVVSSSINPPGTFSFGSVGSGGFKGFGTGAGFPTFNKGFFSKPAESNGSEGQPDQTGAAGGDDEAYEPPKAEVVENAEEGAFHTVRCKLYHKRSDKFEERGVGFLYLKPNGTKTQLLVRTDTALGNILLNINIEKLMPVSLQGKNNITIVCVPNPPVDPKTDLGIPTPILIRVKTEDDARKLYEKITECQASME